MAKPGIGYEQISTGAKDAVGDARDIIANGWQRRGLGLVHLAGPVGWSGLRDRRTFGFYLHALDPIDALLKAYDQTGDIAFLTPALAFADDWVQRHPRNAATDETAPFAWYDMAVGLRSYRLAYLFDAADGEGLLAGPQRATWIERLTEHADYLAQDGNIAMHSNHGFYQVAGQLAMARRLQGLGGPYPALLDSGRERMKVLLDSQFAADGVHLEHSPDYHRMVYQTVQGLLQAGILPDELRTRAIEIEAALSWFVRPDGTITNFGDSDARQMRPHRPVLALNRWYSDAMQFVVTDGAVGRRPDVTLREFRDGGYAVLRQPHADEPPSQDSYLAFNAAFHSRTHKHADDLSFVWDEFGAPILIDAGRYGYIDKTEAGSPLWSEGFWYGDPRRVYVERTRAHNCLEFDDRDYLRRGRKPFGSGLSWTARNGDVTAMRAEARQFGAIRHARTLIVAPRQWLVVLDAWAVAEGQPATRPRQWFQLAPGIAIASAEAGFAGTLGEGRPGLGILPFDPDAARSQPISAQDEPMQGWWSPSEKLIEPATSIWIDAPASTAGHMATLFHLGPADGVAVDGLRASTLARNARLDFRDDQARWRVEIFAAGEAEPRLEITRTPSRNAPQPATPV